ncbi:MAG: TIR domain-containing protein, partial [Gammaproteobacteria bacterium]
MFRSFPNVSTIAMIMETDAAQSLPEKFERLAGEVNGAVALLTPDDMTVTLKTGQGSQRARQNVIMEIGWFWGRLGQKRCMLLVRGDVELPSDLSGVEFHRFKESPAECSEALRDFIEAQQAAPRCVQCENGGGSQMRFYTQQHKFYCGIDLHARTMYVCILNQA